MGSAVLGLVLKPGVSVEELLRPAEIVSVGFEFELDSVRFVEIEFENCGFCVFGEVLG